MEVSTVDLLKAANGPAQNQNNVSSKDTENEFMSLLLAQLRNQNPLEPLDDKEFMGQIIQMSSIKELQGVGKLIKEVLETNQAIEELQTTANTTLIDILKLMGTS